MTAWHNPSPPINRVWCSECERRLEGDEIGLCAGCLEAKRLFWTHHLNIIDGIDEPATGCIKYPNRRA